MKDLHTLDRYRLADDERKYYGRCGDSGNGMFKVFVNGKSLLVIASNGGGWEHVSVSKRNRTPTWDEMCMVKDMFFGAEETVVQYHPPKSDYVNQHPYCLHLWRPTEQAVPRPPAIFVGIKDRDCNDQC